jgi:hypothetical protein
MSFGNIGDIMKKVRGDNDYSDKAMRESISKDTQAFKMFSKGKNQQKLQSIWILERMWQIDYTSNFGDLKGFNN